MKDGNHGLLVLDKPAGITSRDAVNRAYRWFPRNTPIGHTGTLDPLATGVLVLCIGVATRLAEYVQAMKKTYRAGLVLGARSDTDDADGILTPVEGVQPSSEEHIAATLKSFEGEQEQVPPAYSAAKVSGRRAYKLARQGMKPDLQPRSITIYRITMLAYRFPKLDLEIECSKGTYIRALARDLGERLGCGAYVNSLRRTRIGIFGVEDAVSLEASAVTLRPSEDALSELPRCVVDAEAIARLRQGQGLDAAAVFVDKQPMTNTDYAAFDISGILLGVVQWSAEDRQWRPVKVLNPFRRPAA